MASIKIQENFKKYVDFDKSEIDLFFQIAKREVVEKNKYLQKAEENDAHLFHIESGCLMTYVTDAMGQKHVLQFAVDNWWAGDMEAITKKSLTTQNIRAVDRTIVYRMSLNDFNLLTEKCPKFEKYFRILFQNSLITHQKRIIRNIAMSAEQRYNVFTTHYPQMEMLVAQKYIASYLGITPEFFSKLKKQIAERDFRD